ncbi:filamentous hemagglutinin [Opitutaceae bacterium TAV5]|nr:filamentous hemagglutinin [Opitutaceae bacterium TAV5]
MFLPFIYKGSFPRVTAAALFSWLATHTHLSANPSGGHVAAGGATISGGAGALTVNQTTARAIINWQDFSIGAGELVRFVQPDAASATLNRVIGGAPSSLLGNLRANGQVFLINPNGVIVGAGARIDTAGFLASTLDVSDSAFLKGGDLLFTGDSTAAVQNLGAIDAAGGDIFLIARKVENRGTLSAPQGTAGLAAGSEVLLTTGGSQRVFVQAGTAPGLVVNAGKIAAATAELKAAGGNAYALAINNTGVIRATGTAERDGEVWLVAATTAGLDGLARHSGEITATNAGGTGGFVETSGQTVQIADGARVDTRGSSGVFGTWLIDPDDFVISSGGAAQTSHGIGADTLVTNLATSNITLQTTAGNLFVNAAVSWSAGTVLTLDALLGIHFNADITATGDGAGLALTHGAGYGYTLNNGARVTLSGSGASFSVNGSAYTVIRSLEALQGIATADLSGRYVLGVDIDARDTILWNSGAGFAPIGSGGTPFTGVFDGLGNTINGLRINRPSSTHAGLFGALGGTALVRNVGLTGGSVAGSDYTGAVAGTNSGTITNVYTTGTVSGRDTVGGLVGSNDGTITDSHATGAISGTNKEVGGVAGSNSGTIMRTYATGSVAGVWDTGGLVGYNGGDIVESYSTGAVSADFGGGLAGWNDGTITRSYATGSISAGEEAGALAGGNFGTITESYATGLINGWWSMGGLVAWNEGHISSSYWDGDSTGLDFSDGGDRLTTAQAKTAASYVGWDIGNDPSANVWVMIEGQTRPMLAWEYSTRIATGHQLQLIGLNSETLAAHYTLVRDLDLSGTGNVSSIWGGGGGFVPIGSSATPFTGTLDGHGHTISGLVIDRGTESRVGLFGVAGPGSQLLDVGLAGGSVTGHEAVGSLVGLNDGGVITQAYSTGAVSGTGSSVGGLVGYNREGEISQSYATGAVSGDSAVGGLVGRHEGGSISQSYATGEVSGNEYAGALAGVNDGGAIDTSYWNVDTAGGLPGVGSGAVDGVVGLTTDEFMYLRLPSGFSAATWYAATGDYPLLRWQLASLPENTLVGALEGAGEGITLALVINGQQVATTVTAEEGAFVFYYSGEFEAGTTALVYTVGDDYFRSNRLVSLAGNLTEEVALANRQVWVTSGATRLSDLIADMGNVLGSFSDADILYAFSGDVFGMTAGIGLRLELSSDVFTFDTALNLPGNTLRINAPGSLIAPHALVAGGFILEQGEWIQNDATLPVFEVGDFRIEGGRFLRAVGGDGSADTPWLLADIYGLQGIITGSRYAHYELAGDIDAGGTANWNDGEGFLPVTYDSTYPEGLRAGFQGVLDGRGHTVNGLTINRPAMDDVGLFGILGDLAEVRDLGLVGGSIVGRSSVGSIAGTHYGAIRRSYATASVSGNDVVGGLVGYSGYESFAGRATTVIEWSYATGTVTAITHNAGGLVGHTWEGEILYSYATGAVTGGFQVGGLVGTSIDTSIKYSYATGAVTGEYLVGGLAAINYLGTIEQSYATGAVSGESSIGGLVGWNDRGTVRQSYATGAVTGEDEVGGLVGDNDRGSVIQSYATGAVSGEDDVGGLIGYNHRNSTVTRSVWDVDTTGQNAAVGGGSRTVDATGLTTAQMTDPASFAEWSIDAEGGADTVWRIYAGNTAPLLKAFLTRLEVNGEDKTVAYTGLAQTSGYSVNGPYDTSLLLGSTSSGINAGSYDVTTGLYSSQQGYDLVSTGSALTIVPVSIVVTANGGASVYGDTPANPGLAAEGLVNGETVAVLTGLDNSFGIGATTNAGSHTLTVEGTLTNGNYIITTRNDGTWIVSPKEITVTANGGTSTYGDAPANPGFTAGGLVNGETVAVLTGLGNSFGITGTTNAGSHTLTVEGTLTNGNYTIAQRHDGAWIVSPKEITVAANGGTSTYGDAPANPGITAEGLVNGETVDVLTGLANSFGVGATTGAGSYTLTVEGELANGNYTVMSRHDGTWIVSPKDLLITANDATRLTDSPNPVFTASFEGLVNGETADVVSGLEFTTPATPESEPGAYAITPWGAAAANYAIRYEDGVLTVVSPGITVDGYTVPVVQIDGVPVRSDKYAAVVRGGRTTLVPLVDAQTGESRAVEQDVGNALASPPLLTFSLSPSPSGPPASYRAGAEGEAPSGPAPLAVTSFSEFLKAEGAR